MEKLKNYIPENKIKNYPFKGGLKEKIEFYSTYHSFLGLFTGLNEFIRCLMPKLSSLKTNSSLSMIQVEELFLKTFEVIMEKKEKIQENLTFGYIYNIFYYIKKENKMTEIPEDFITGLKEEYSSMKDSFPLLIARIEKIISNNQFLSLRFIEKLKDFKRFLNLYCCPALSESDLKTAIEEKKEMISFEFIK